MIMGSSIFACIACALFALSGSAAEARWTGGRKGRTSDGQREPGGTRPEHVRSDIYWTRGIPVRSGGRQDLSWQGLVQPSIHRYESLVEGALARMGSGDARSRKEIVAILLEAVRLEPERTEALALLARVYYDRGSYRRALRQIRKIHEMGTYRMDRSVRLIEALSLVRLGEHDKGASVFYSLVEPSDPPERKAGLLANGAVAAVAAGRLATAIRWYGRAVAEAPHYLPARYGLAIAMLKDGRFDKGLSQLRMVIKADPKLKALRKEGSFFIPTWDRFFYQASVLQAAGCRPRAAAVWKKYLRRAGKGPYVWAAKALISRLSATKPSPRRRKWCTDRRKEMNESIGRRRPASRKEREDE
jgi:tetratricopeptide (TPR) repeat protein